MSTRKAYESRFFDPNVMTIDELIARRLSTFTRDELFIGIPAKVTNVDDYETLQCINVQTIFHVRDFDKQVNVPVQINKVFVKLQQGNGFSVQLPIAVGDLVTLQWSHTTLGKFLDSDANQIITLDALEKWQELRDCWATHGFGTRRNNLQPSRTNFVIKGGNTSIVITPDGYVNINSNKDISLSTPEGINLSCKKFKVEAEDTEITGNINVGGSGTVQGDLTISDISFVGHEHTTVAIGSPTSPPIK